MPDAFPDRVGISVGRTQASLFLGGFLDFPSIWVSIIEVD